MEQRPLRLGDIVDDYCPRERRITNHAIVALVGEDIRQTRCSTCDAEHVFKGGQVPKRTALRRKDSDTVRPLVTPGPAPDAASPLPLVAAAPAATASGPAPSQAASVPPSEDTLAAAGDTHNGHEDHVDGWLAHRPLIRATLPRTEGDVPTPRPIPEFTMHQRQARGGRAFRQSYGWSGGGGGNQPNGGFRNGRPVDGNVAGGNGSHDRHGGGHGRHQGHGGGHGRGGGPPGPGGGRPGRHRGGGGPQNKRSR